MHFKNMHPPMSSPLVDLCSFMISLPVEMRPFYNFITTSGTNLMLVEVYTGTLNLSHLPRGWCVSDKVEIAS